MICKYETHLCSTYKLHRERFDEPEFFHAGGVITDYHSGGTTGMGLGTQHGRVIHEDTHSGRSRCGPADSLRVYHGHSVVDTAGGGHHCKLSETGRRHVHGQAPVGPHGMHGIGAAECRCRCNSIFSHANGYNPRARDLFDHGVTPLADAQTAAPTPFPSAPPTPRPTNYPTSYPTSFPTSYPTAYPTPYPTAFPTAFPTPYPTPFPTPEPVDGWELVFHDEPGAVRQRVGPFLHAPVAQLRATAASGEVRLLSLVAGASTIADVLAQPWRDSGFDQAHRGGGVDYYKTFGEPVQDYYSGVASRTTTLYFLDDHDVKGYGACSQDCTGRQTQCPATPDGLISFGASDGPDWADYGSSCNNAGTVLPAGDGKEEERRPFSSIVSKLEIKRAPAPPSPPPTPVPFCLATDGGARARTCGGGCPGGTAHCVQGQVFCCGNGGKYGWGCEVTEGCMQSSQSSYAV